MTLFGFGNGAMRRVLALSGLLSLFVVACAAGPSTSDSIVAAKQGGTLTIATGTDADTLDPGAQTTTLVGQMVALTVEPLVQMNAQGKTVPGLATSWSESSDGLTYTFNLRRNVTFQDGEPFNAAAVVKSLDRLNDPSTYSAQPGPLTVIQSVTAVDDHQVRVQLKSAYLPFLAAMTEIQAGILAPASLTQHGNTPDKVVWPVGTGPYTYTGRVEGEYLSWSRYDHYWGPRPAYRKQVYRVVPNASSREALLKSGQAQVVSQPAPNDLPELRNASGLKVIMAPDDRVMNITINTDDAKNPKLSTPLVRQALNYAVDKQAIIKKIQFGAARPLTAPMAPSIFGYCDTTGATSYAYNPGKAKKLLQQAGAEGMTLTLASPEGHYAGDYQTAQTVAADLNAVGLHVTVPNPPTWPSYQAETRVPASQATVDMDLRGWAPSYMDASEMLQPFEQSQMPPGPNMSYWYAAKTDNLIDAAQSTTTKATAQSDYCQAAKQIWDAAPWIWLYVAENPIVTTDTVKGIVGLPNEEFLTAFAKPGS